MVLGVRLLGAGAGRGMAVLMAVLALVLTLPGWLMLAAGSLMVWLGRRLLSIGRWWVLRVGYLVMVHWW
jgi:hypothetical protein